MQWTSIVLLRILLHILVTVRFVLTFRSWIKGAVVLVILLGLTWSLGLLYVNSSTIWLAYVFTIVNTLQGLFIFLFHCVYNEKVRWGLVAACARDKMLLTA